MLWSVARSLPLALGAEVEAAAAGMVTSDSHELLLDIKGGAAVTVPSAEGATEQVTIGAGAAAEGRLRWSKPSIILLLKWPLV